MTDTEMLAMKLAEYEETTGPAGPLADAYIADDDRCLDPVEVMTVCVAYQHLQQQLTAARAERDAAVAELTELRQRDRVISRQLEQRATGQDAYAQSLVRDVNSEMERSRAAEAALARVTAERDGLRTALRELRDAEATLSKAKVDAAQAQAATGAVSDEDSDEVFAEKIRVRNEMFDAQMRCAERLLAAREQADAALQPATEDGR